MSSRYIYPDSVPSLGMLEQRAQQEGLALKSCFAIHATMNQNVTGIAQIDAMDHFTRAVRSTPSQDHIIALSIKNGAGNSFVISEIQGSQRETDEDENNAINIATELAETGAFTCIKLVGYNAQGQIDFCSPMNVTRQPA